MSLSLPEGFDVRSATDADAEAVAELSRAFDLAVHGMAVITAGDIREWWRVTDPAKNTWILHAGDEIGTAATLWPQGVPNALADVSPDLFGRGLGSALLDLTEARARELGASAIQIDVFGKDRAAAELLEGRGYRPVRRYYEMRIVLGDDSENPSGATRLYERAGMHVESESVTFGRALA